MNLIDDAWISVVRQDGTQCRIPPWQISGKKNPVVEIKAPRPDFQGALYQFLIGLLQVTRAPDDDDDWFEGWENPPTEEELKKSFSSVAPAFYLTSDGVAFLQDFDLKEGEEKPISALLVESPGSQTIKKNMDLFVKRGIVRAVCESCTAIALFALQSSAPSGGSGHRVGLRGGGPLNTLVLPEDPGAPLWKKLWFNVLPKEGSESGVCGQSSIFPWLAKTRTSESGQVTQPFDTHWLQMYWGMPRRIRLNKSDESGCCDLCGRQSNRLFTSYITKNYGVNYEGPWMHPLTPYRTDPKKQTPPLSIKGQKGGLGYRHFLGLSLSDSEHGNQAAEVVDCWQERLNEYPELEEAGKRLWCFGYDMDNMKARCWYEQHMPLLKINKSYRDTFVALVSQMMDAARSTLKLLRTHIKAAWFESPKNVKGDIGMIDRAFWSATESAFYSNIGSLASLPESTASIPPELASRWVNVLHKTACDQFDFWVLEGDPEDRDMKRIFDNRRWMVGKLKKEKGLKPLWELASSLQPEKSKPEAL